MIGDGACSGTVIVRPFQAKRETPWTEAWGGRALSWSCETQPDDDNP